MNISKEEFLETIEKFKEYADTLPENIQEDIWTILNFLNDGLDEQTESNKELNKVLIHFKAVINEMADYINNKDNGDIYDLVCTRECENDKCRLSNGDNEYQELECIKEYFSKKVE